MNWEGLHRGERGCDQLPGSVKGVTLEILGNLILGVPLKLQRRPQDSS